MSSDAPGGRLLSGYVDVGHLPERRARDTVLVRTDDPFPVVLGKRRLGPVGVCLLQGGRIDVVPYGRRSPASDVEVDLMVGLVASGAMTVAQRGRTVDLTEGEIVVYDGGRPARLHSPGPHRYLVAHLPGHALRTSPDDRASLSARGLDACLGASALTTLMSTLADSTAVGLSPRAGEHLGDAVLACVRALVAESRGASSGDRAEHLYGTLTEWLERHLAEVVGTERLAAHHFISARYVRKVFASQGTTVTEYVRRRRLERIRDDLLQPWTAALPVGAVAARWGMRDPSVFSRAFSRQFGQSPQRFRKDLASRSAGAAGHD